MPIRISLDILERSLSRVKCQAMLRRDNQPDPVLGDVGRWRVSLGTKVLDIAYHPLYTLGKTDSDRSAICVLLGISQKDYMVYSTVQYLSQSLVQYQDYRIKRVADCPIVELPQAPIYLISISKHAQMQLYFDGRVL